MPPLASALLRTGLALKINQVKRATTSYAHDRAEQGQSAITSYAVAGGLYAAAGVFAIALLLVGVTALFRWVELRYGLFEAFGASAAVLLVLAIICAALAANRLKRPARRFPSLGSRLRVAISATPTAASKPATSVAAPMEFKPSRPPQPPAPNGGQIKAGLVIAASLAGWVLARRRSVSQNARTPRTPRPMDKANA